MAASGRSTVAAILLAAGDGRRLGATVPKAFVLIGDRTMLEHAVSRFVGHPLVRDVVIVAPAAFLDRAREVAPGASVVAGGSSRQRSVALGLAALAPDVDVVLVHDVARAFVPSAVISRTIDGLARQRTDATVPVLNLTDTIRQVAESGELGELVDRSRLLAMQTPQGFHRDTLVAAHARGVGVDATDDAALVEAIGGRLMAVRGDERAFKITVPFDLVLAEVLAGE